MAIDLFRPALVRAIGAGRIVDRLGQLDAHGQTLSGLVRVGLVGEELVDAVIRPMREDIVAGGTPGLGRPKPS
jgi:hypothetical protein